jgi:hypothetical protein
VGERFAGRDSTERDAMRKIVNSTYVTLDGVISDLPDWPALGSRCDDPYTDRINAITQYVVSTALESGIVILTYRTTDADTTE